MQPQPLEPHVRSILLSFFFYRSTEIARCGFRTFVRFFRGAPLSGRVLGGFFLLLLLRSLHKFFMSQLMGARGTGSKVVPAHICFSLLIFFSNYGIIFSIEKETSVEPKRRAFYLLAPLLPYALMCHHARAQRRRASVGCEN